MLKLTGLTLEGFMSFSAPFSDENLPGLPGRGRMTNRLALGDATILIGPNGAGKSNIVSFFRMLTAMVAGTFQEFVARSGYADSLLHYGAKKTPKMKALFEIEDRQTTAKAEYELSLASAAGGWLVLTEESARYSETKDEPLRQLLPVSTCARLEDLLARTFITDRSGLQLYQSALNGDRVSTAILGAVAGLRFYHFADTSENAGIRQNVYKEESANLRRDGGNLAAFLYGLKSRAETEPYYKRVENTIKLAYPQLRRFALEPQATNDKYVMLNWYSRDADYMLGPHQMSDGALRFSALAALLLEPPDRLPSLIVLDEPELGLHPGAIELLAEMIKGVALEKQILVATQSPQLVNYFDLSQIRPIEYHNGRSVILELDPDAYKDWLEEYSTGELWAKNVIGGGPTHG